MWPDRGGEPCLPARRFGGVGLMVERPAVEVAASAASEWSADGALAERALAFALRFADAVRRERPDAEPPPQRLVVRQAPPEHVGLGVGTQLGMAVARALAEAWGLALDAPRPGPAGRPCGLRLGRLGVHGFAHGGFLVESGKAAGRDATWRRWRRAAAVPARLAAGAGRDAGRGAGTARPRGAARRSLASSAPAFGPRRTEALCRLVLLGMLPALAEADLDAFGEALHDFNARVGEAFAPVQGGVYSGPRVAELVEFVRRTGVRGVGQSSWGPTVFAVVGDEGRADDLRRRLDGRFGLGPAVWTTAACNRGAGVEGG